MRFIQGGQGKLAHRGSYNSPKGDQVVGWVKRKGRTEGRTCVLPKALPRRTSEVQFRNLEEALSRRGGAAQWKVNKRGAGLEAR